MDKEEKPDQKKPTDREELADKVLDIFSDRPEEMSSLIEILKKLEKNPVLHPERKSDDKSTDIPEPKQEKELRGKDSTDKAE